MLRPTLCVLLALTSLRTYAAEPVGRGSYATALPAGVRGPSSLDNQPVLPKRTARVTGPAPTNDWWSSLIWQRYPANAYSENLYPHPLALHARASGLGLGYPTTPAVSHGSPAYIGEYHYTYAEDAILGVEGLSSGDTKVDGFSAFAVTALWSGGGRELRATFGQGLPFVYATASGGDGLVTFTAPPTVVSNTAGVAAVTVNGHAWGLFAPSGCAWAVQGNALRSTLCGKGYFSVALLPDATAATLAFFQRHAYAFVSSTKVSWRYDARSAQLTSRFEVVTEPKEGTESAALLALYPHHWKHTAAPLTPYGYLSPRGAMKVVAGRAFETALRFNGVLPNLPGYGSADRDTLRALVTQVAAEQSPLLSGGSGSYWVGKALQRLAVLVRVAEQVDLPEARDTLLARMKALLEDWLSAGTGEASRLFAYEPTWGTLIGVPAEYGSDAELNDHHFHYGYFIYAAATVAQHDPEWAKKERWGGMVELLIRDANSPDPADPKFPFLRSFDPYAGHGWASGHAGFAAGNNQESSSEGMNFAQAVVLWGAVTGDTALRDLGIFLYANEAEVISQGWFDKDMSVFPAGFPHTAAGIVWGDGASYATWFSSNPAMIHGINFLPISGGSLYLARDGDYLKANYAEMVKNGGGEPSAWQDVHWEVLALADPAAALAKFNATPSYTGEDGETRAHTYHWLHALDALGVLEPSVTGTVPTSAVFAKGGERTYVAYNPDFAPARVDFTDGKSLEVPARTLLSGKGAVLPPLPGSDAGTTGPAADGGGVDSPSPDGGAVCAQGCGCSGAGRAWAPFLGLALLGLRLRRRRQG